MQNSYSRQAEAEYAGFWVRLAAYVLDSVIIGAGLLAVRLVLAVISALTGSSFLENNILFQYTWKDIILYVCRVLYFILMTYSTGMTLGKRALNLRVVNADQSEKLSILKVVYRETIGRFLSGILYIGYLMIVPGREKCALHDMLCDTRVIYAKTVKIYEIPVSYSTTAAENAQSKEEPAKSETEQPQIEFPIADAEQPQAEVPAQKTEQPQAEVPAQPTELSGGGKSGGYSYVDPQSKTDFSASAPENKE